MLRVSCWAASTQGYGERFLLWAVRAGVLGVLAIPLVVTPDTIFPFIAGKALLARTIIEVTLGCWLVLVLCCPEYRPPRSNVLLAFGLWLLVLVLAALAGVSPVRSFWSTYERMVGIVDLAHWLAYALIAASVFRSLPDWRLAFSFNLAVCGLASLMGIGQHLGLYETRWLTWPIDASRLSSTLGNPAYLGGYAAVSSLTGIGLLAHSLASRQLPAAGTGKGAARRSGRRTWSVPGLTGEFWLRAFWLTAVLLALWALWLSATRGSIIAFAVGVLVFVAGYMAWGRLRLVRRAALSLLLSLAAVAALLLAVVFAPGPVPTPDSNVTLDRLLFRASPYGIFRSVEHRIESMEAGARAFRDRPFLGWGHQNYLVAWGRYVDPENPSLIYFDQAHNRLLEELVASGIVGLLSYLAIWGLAAWVIIRSVRRRRPGGQLLVFLAGGAALAAYFTQNLFLFDTPATVMLFALLLAFVAAEEEWLSGYGRHAARASGDSLAAALGRKLRRSGIARPLGFPAAARRAAALTVGLLVVLTVFFVNVRAWQASLAAGGAFAPSASVEAQASGLAGSIELFPGLANYPRVHLWSWARRNFDEMTDGQFDRTMSRLVDQGHSALRAEPENWRLHAELAQLYQAAARRDSGYLPDARGHVERVLRLAPGLPHGPALKRIQERLEGGGF